MTIDYLQQHGHFQHQNQGNKYESEPSPRPYWSPDHRNSTDGNMHENIKHGVSTGYCFKFQMTSARTQKSCKFMHVHPSRPYPGFSPISIIGLIKLPTNNQIIWDMKVQSQDLVVTIGMIHVS